MLDGGFPRGFQPPFIIRSSSHDEVLLYAPRVEEIPFFHLPTHVCMYYCDTVLYSTVAAPLSPVRAALNGGISCGCL